MLRVYKAVLMMIKKNIILLTKGSGWLVMRAKEATSCDKGAVVARGSAHNKRIGSSISVPTCCIYLTRVI